MAGRYFRRARRAASDSQGSSFKGRRRALRCEPLEERRLLAVLTVDTHLDVVDFNDGKMSLREAVFVANTVEGVDEIRFDFGQDLPAAMLLTGGEFAITDGLTIVGPGSGALTIDAQRNSRIFNVSGEGVDVELSGMTLLNGRTSGDNLTYSEVTQQKFSGGAIRSAAGATLSIDSVVIRGSSVTGDNTSGGAIFASASLVVTNSVISGNSASGRNGVGGGIAATRYAAITATTVSDNTASRGGGVSVSSTGTLVVERSTLSSNVAADSFAALGGAIYATGLTEITNSTISGNSAKSTGFDSMAQGAGIWVSGDATIRHSTIIANTASSLGAGAVGIAGGVYAAASASASLSIEHTIVAGNFATEGPAEMLVGDRTLRVHYSLIADNDGTVLSEAPVGWADYFGNLIGGATYGVIDPLLGGLADNGGPTRTHALLPGSPAIFAGDPWRAPGDDWSQDEGTSTTPEFDQRGEGYSRRSGTRMDIGAVEYSGRTLIVDSLHDAVDGDYGPGQFTLREALLQANKQSGYDVIEFANSLYFAQTPVIQLVLGDLPISDELAIYGRGAESLVIRGSGQPARVVRATADALLQGVTITGGDARGEGGGISSSKHLTLIDVTVKENRSVYFAGGGIWATDLTMVASRVEDNAALSGGGGVHVTGGLTMDRSVVSGNQALDTRDGVGGIFAPIRRDQPSSASVSISHSTIVGNTGGRIGGIAINARHFEMHHTLVSENSGSGGGVEALNTLNFHISHSSIVQNSGFGLSITTLLDEALVEDSTISGNRTLRMAGGIAVAGKATLRRVTVTDNSAEGRDASGDGGGIVVAGRLTLENTIVAGNHAPKAPDIWQRPNATIDAEYSFIGDNRGTTLVETHSDNDQKGNYIGGPERGALPPGLGPLLDNGGPRLPEGHALPTHLPLPESRVINRGKPALQPGNGTTPEFDQRGEPYTRVVGGQIDIGAVEASIYSGVATGDFNQDGKVDGADFLSWQRGFGTIDGSVADGDATGDGQVDGNDLAVWKNSYGSGVNRAEPATTAAGRATSSAVSSAASVSQIVAVQPLLAEVPAAATREFVTREFVAASSAEAPRERGVPLTPSIESATRRTIAAESLASKHAAFALAGEVRGGAEESAWRGVERRAAWGLAWEASEVDEAFEDAAEEVDGMESWAWGSTGR